MKKRQVQEEARKRLEKRKAMQEVKAQSAEIKGLISAFVKGLN